MVRHSSVEVSWAGDTFTFDLPIGQLRELEAKCNAGPQWIAMRLERDVWRLPDCWDTVRLGLIGGGLAPSVAFRKMTARIAKCEPLKIDWGEGETSFALPFEQYAALEAALDCGLPDARARLIEGSWRIDQIRETLRLGMIGAGMDEKEADRLVVAYVDHRPKLESLTVAHTVLSHAIQSYQPLVQIARAVLLACVLIGVPDDQPDAPPGESEAKESSAQTEGTPSPISTDGAPFSDGPLAK